MAWAIDFRFLFFILIILMFAYISYGQTIENYQFPNDYRGVIHLHSELSYDSDGKFEDIAKAAEKNEVDFVVLTDHWSPELFKKSKRGFFGKTLFIAGAEISKNDGITLITFPLPQNFVPENDWRKNVESLRKNGAVAAASHIEFSQTADLIGVDSIEMTNLHSILVDRNYFGFAWAWLKALWYKNWDLGFIFDSGAVKNLPRWHYLNQDGPLPAFAGNDTHDNYRLFWKFGPKLGSYNNTFKLITTHIWAEKLSEESVKEAIKNGQSYFAFEALGNAKWFRFYATNNNTIYVQAPPHQNPKKTKLKILRDGKVVKEGTGILLNFEAKESGNYYAEIWKDSKPWIFSNPIKIRPH